MSVESLKVFKYKPADPAYIAIYDFQWKTGDGEPAGLRCAVRRNHGFRGDYFRKITNFGTLALRRVGDEDEFRAELRTGDHAYELPIINGDA